MQIRDREWITGRESERWNEDGEEKDEKGKEEYLWPQSFFFLFLTSKLCGNG